MMLIVASSIFVAWAAFISTAASHYGRVLQGVHRIARLVGIAGAVLSMPAILMGTFGLPTGCSWHWLGTAAQVGYFGLALAIAGGAAWLIADSLFVWQHRRQVFPYVFRGAPDGEE